MLKHWSNKNVDGFVTPGSHFIKHADYTEILDYINKLRRIAHKDNLEIEFKGSIKKTIPEQIQYAIEHLVQLYSTYGKPFQATPFRADWICTKQGSNKNKLIAMSDGSEKVSLKELVSETGKWTDTEFTNKYIRAPHINEMREALSYLNRGCWQYYLGTYFSISQKFPDTAISESKLYNKNGDKRKAIGAVFMHYKKTLGLRDVTIRPESSIILQADSDVTVKLYHCNMPQELFNDRPTWNKIAPSAGTSWSTPGASSSSDATLIATCQLESSTPFTISGATVQSTIQKIANGKSKYFIISPESECNSTTVSAVVNAIFDINN